MKKTYKLGAWLMIVLTVFWGGLSPASAQESVGVYGDFIYELADQGNEWEVRIVEYLGSESFVVIPSSIDGAPVTELGYGAFSSNDFLQGVLLPETLEVIGDNCFYYCTSLKEVLLPDSICYIGSYAFWGCTALETIDLPRPIDYIGQSAFGFTPWEDANPDWCNRLTVIEISTAQELAEQMRLTASQPEQWSNYGYDRQEIRILNDIDCTGMELDGFLYSQSICGWDAKTNQPAVRKISNADFTPYGMGDTIASFHGCSQCEERGQEYFLNEETFTYVYTCDLHSDCLKECADCHEGLSWSGMYLGFAADDISHLTLDGWTVHSIHAEGEPCCEEYAEDSNIMYWITAENAQHLTITDFHYEGKTNGEQLSLLHSYGTLEDIRMDELRFTLPDGCSFENLLLAVAGTAHRCMISNVDIEAAANAVYTMALASLYSEGSTDCLVSGIHARSASSFIGLFSMGSIQHAVVRDMTLESLEEGASQEEGAFIGIAIADIFQNAANATTQGSSHLVVDVSDPLLTSPVAYTHTNEVRLDQVYYTDETGRFDPVRDFFIDSADPPLSIQGVYRVKAEELYSDAVLAALNQPVHPGTDKTTANHWARGEDYCDGCPVPYVCSPFASPAQTMVYGDVDENGKVDATDALWMLQASVDLRELDDDQAEVADVNGDYKVNASDALLALQRSVKLVDRFPMEPYTSLLAF